MRNRVTNVLWGLFFVVIGLGFAGNAFGLWDFKMFFNGWWTLFIIIPCFISMIKSGFGTGSTIGVIIGVILLLSYQPGIGSDIRKLIIPLILIFIGIKIIFRDVFAGKKHIKFNIHKESADGSYQADYSAIFSSNKVRINTEKFEGADLNAIFGGIEMDLRDAIIDSDIQIDCNAIFGGIDIIVPRSVQVKVNSVPIFGGVSNKTVVNNDPELPTIYIDATCMFGGIDIK